MSPSVGSPAVLVLLPPSETKQLGGDGPPLRLEALSHPDLTQVRRKLIDELVALAGDVSAGLAALGLSQHQHGELERNGALCSAPTLPALRRYTGVLYTALDANSLRPAQCARLSMASALFGLLRRTTGYRPTGCPPRRRCRGWVRCARCGVRCSARY